MAEALILDTEALNALAQPRERRALASRAAAGAIASSVRDPQVEPNETPVAMYHGLARRHRLPIVC
jgi:hypothetical protein